MDRRDFVPDNVDDLLEMEPEDLAEHLLHFLSLSRDHTRRVTRRGVIGNLSEGFSSRTEDAAVALTAAWMWLERECLLIPDPYVMGGDWMLISPRGERLAAGGGFREFRASQLLPREGLHPVIVAKVRGDFVRGDYETAVFKAYKEVEIAVREAGGFSNSDLGTKLMRKAFRTESGPLCDATDEPSEQQATSDLFAGAIGRLKNPGSHRRVDFDDPVAVVEVIMFASHLMRIVDGRRE